MDIMKFFYWDYVLGKSYQQMDNMMKEKGMSKGKFNSVAQANGGIENMINWDGR